MSYAIRLLLTEPARYLARFDPEANAGRYPTGAAAWSTDPREAIAFESIAQALTFYRTQSTTTPTRPDGRPNRPLTAYTVEISELDTPTGGRPDAR